MRAVRSWDSEAAYDKLLRRQPSHYAPFAIFRDIEALQTLKVNMHADKGCRLRYAGMAPRPL